MLLWILAESSAVSLEKLRSFLQKPKAARAAVLQAAKAQSCQGPMLQGSQGSVGPSCGVGFHGPSRDTNIMDCLAYPGLREKKKLSIPFIPSAV